MAQEYIAMEKKDAGLVALNTNVFSSIAKICIDDDENVSLANINTPFKNTIISKVEEGKLVMTLNINVKYNVNVQETCRELQHKIYENIKHMCEIDTPIIDIKVCGFDF